MPRVIEQVQQIKPLILKAFRLLLVEPIAMPKEADRWLQILKLMLKVEQLVRQVLIPIPKEGLRPPLI